MPNLDMTKNSSIGEISKDLSQVVKKPVLIEKSITENGTYLATDDNADGYSSVNVSGVLEHGISYDAFDENGNVIEATIVGFTEIPKYALYGCDKLQNVNLSSGITSIGNSAFHNCTSLALTSLPEGITSIGESAFLNCTSLALTSLPEGITSLGWSAFDNCTSLALTSLPEGITVIGIAVFQGCSSIESISLPAGLTSIGYDTFAGCTGLQTITFNSKPDIQRDIFAGCTNLTTINVPWSENEVAGAPWGATNATINYNYVPE